MAKLFLSLLVLSSIVACEQNPLWVGKKEHLTFSYTYSNDLFGPTVNQYTKDKSSFIEYETINAIDLGNGTVQITVSGVRVQSDRNNFEVTDIEVYEKDGRKFESQNEFGSVSSSTKNDIAAVLVLDMSTSLSGLTNDLKTYAKNFIDIIVGGTVNSTVAVVFFSGKENIHTTGFYNSTNCQALKDSIDAFNDFQPRTALFQATLEGIALLDNLVFEGPKTLVIFTDGGDNDTDNPTQAKETISASSYYRVSIGLEGTDFDKEDLGEIATSTRDRVIAKKPEDLEKIFNDVAKQVSSVYQVTYARSDQNLDESIDIKFVFEVKKLD